MTEITIRLPKLHNGQKDIAMSSARFRVLTCGRRFGKSLFGLNCAIEAALAGQPVGWYSPTYKMLSEIWRQASNLLQPITKRTNSQERRLELITGGVIDFWSLDNPDSSRGRKYKRVIIDEAAMVPRLTEAWQNVIRPTLTDLRGDGLFLSTPKGFNFFKALFDMGRDPARPEWACWQLPTRANPYIPPDEIESARLELPERVFKQEYLAEFIEDANLFRNVTACATAIAARPQPGINYVFGVDWGKFNDFTAITVWDTFHKQMVHLDRFNQIDYTVQAGRLAGLYRQYKPSVILAESNAMGEPIIDQLRAQGLPVRGFQTTNISKAQIINQLSLAFEQKSIRILDDPVLIAELQAYEATRLPGGTLRYSAPEGQHDDTVIATALGVEAMVQRPIEVINYAPTRDRRKH